MRIDYLINNPGYIPIVAGWIYKKIVVNIMQGISLEKIIIEQMHVNSLPIILIALDGNACAETVSLFVNDLKLRMDLTLWIAAAFC